MWYWMSSREASSGRLSRMCSTSSLAAFIAGSLTQVGGRGDGGRERLAAIEAPAGLPDGQRAAVRSAVEQAFLHAYRGVMLATAGLALLASLSAWWLIPNASPAMEGTPGSSSPGTSGSAPR